VSADDDGGYRVGSLLLSEFASKLPRMILLISHSSIPTVGFNMKKVQKGHVTLKWYVSCVDDSEYC